MPLSHGKSEKSFEKNFKTEMNAGKPKDQSLAIAYSVKRKAKDAKRKKMATGGDPADSPNVAETSVRPDKGWGKVIVLSAEGGEISANNEKRPMPDNSYNDEDEMMNNRSNKALKDSDWTDNPTMRQAKNKPRVEAIRHPKMVPSNSFSTRLYDKEGNLQESAKPGPYDAKPPKDDDEMKADRKGPNVPDMEDEHNNHRKPYAKGGEINKLIPMEESEEDHAEHPSRLEEDDDQMRPPMEDYMSDEKQLAEGGDVEDTEETEDREPAADHFADLDDENMQPMDEMEEEHHSSIADAIMARKHANMRLNSGSKDMDEAEMYAEGGEVDLDENSMEQPNQYYPRNEHEVLKENYAEDLHDLHQPGDSNLKGDEEEKDSENKHDMISQIRMRMRAKRRI